jgi:Kelch motif
MNDARFEDFVAVLLPGRKVLVAGGTAADFVSSLKSAEVFDEKTGTWSTTKDMDMNIGRGEFANVKLHDGRVLVMGGTTQDGSSPTHTAEIFDPETQKWTFTGSMTTGREDHAAVVLLDGRVLVAGGTMSEGSARFTSAEIFDPETGNWSLTGSMNVGRSEIEYTAVRLPDGRVLVPGGHSAPHTETNSADLFDPETGTWTPAGLMNAAPRWPRRHSAAWQSRSTGDGRAHESFSSYK